MPRLDELPPERVADAVAKAVVDAVGQGGDTDAIVARALARVKGELGLGPEGPARRKAEGALRSGVGDGLASGATTPRPSGGGVMRGAATGASRFHPAPMGSGKSVGGSNGSGRPLITEADVIAAWRSGRTELRVAP
ncbi:MAG: hypothetical protein ACT4PO_05270, partial [Actinomycetota bacterium]